MSSQKKKQPLLLHVGDRTLYVSLTGRVYRGTVVVVVPKLNKKGYIYTVDHDDADGSEGPSRGEFRWDHPYLFKEGGDPIPDALLREHEDEEEAPGQ